MQFHNGITGLEVVQKYSRCVDSSFCPPSHSKAQLARCKKHTHFLHHSMASNLSSEMKEGVSHSDRSHTPFFLLHSTQISPKNHSSICCLTAEVKESVWSRLAGVLRHRGPKCNRRTQATGVFLLTIDWRIPVSFLSAGALQDRGIHFRIFTAVLCGSTEGDVGGLGIAL